MRPTRNLSRSREVTHETDKVIDGSSRRLRNDRGRHVHQHSHCARTSNKHGGTDEHFGLVKYGTDPHNLNLTAKGHIRLNRNHPYTVFRVRLEDIKPGTTYYYTVDSMEATDELDGVKSTVYHFSPRE